MSFWTAHNLGAQKIAHVSEMLNVGASLSEVAKYLHISISRTSRIVRSLFKKIYVPQDWTVDAITFESNSHRLSSQEIDRLCEDSLNHAKEYAKTLSTVTGKSTGKGS